MKKSYLKKIHLFACALAVVCVALLTVSCADANGLHNTKVSTLTFVFVNFPADDGAYAIPGDHNNWDNTETLITLKDGAGTSESITIAQTSDEFTLVKKDSWQRKWEKSEGGTIEGKGRVGPESSHNFLAEGLELGTDITITVDGSTPVATVTVEKGDRR